MGGQEQAMRVGFPDRGKTELHIGQPRRVRIRWVVRAAARVIPCVPESTNRTDCDGAVLEVHLVGGRSSE
jgi:hypothetical protein